MALEYSPWLGDGQTLLLFSASWAGGVGDRDLYSARRASPTDPFGSVALEPGLSSPQKDDDPWMSPDGRTIFFASARSGATEIFEAHR